jgi:16S rRNA (guanine527-N7)-methyltransferase
MPSLSQCPVRFGSTAWERLISSSAEEFGIEVSALQMVQLTKFSQILCEWNKRINLTAITHPEEVAIKHFIDSMAVLPFLPNAERLLDIGSGGGFPGLVLAVFRPDLQITSIDSVRKKISFQQHIIRTLGLKGVNALHVRAESLAPADRSSAANRYDIIVSRALGGLDLFVGLALPLLAPGGTIIAYKGTTSEDERDEIESSTAGQASLSIDIRKYCLPKYGDRRTLVFVKST